MGRLRAADGARPERHDIMSQETHAGTWIGFRQPVLARVQAARGRGRRADARLESRRGLGRGRVLDRADPQDRSRRFARHPQVLRVEAEARDADLHRRVLRRHLRQRRARPARGRCGRRDSSPLGLHARYGAYDVPYGGQERYERDGFKTPSGKLEVGYSSSRLPSGARGAGHARLHPLAGALAQPRPGGRGARASCRRSACRR